MEYAPIIVFVYKRLEQTRKTFESLINNELARESELYIYSDGPKNEEERKAVEQVREYIHDSSIRNAFKDVFIKEHNENHGLANSIIMGVSQIISEKGRVIVVEDDLQASPLFLEYMNECLEFYQNDEKIWSISGYSPELSSLKDYDLNVYLNFRASTWGWGTWKDRWETVDWEIKDYKKFKYNIKRRMLLCRGGNDMPSMLKAQMRGKIDSWGIRWCYNQSSQNKLSVAPTVSLIRNNGFDGSGTHSTIDDSKRFLYFELENKKKNWRVKKLQLEKEICREIYKLNSIPMRKRIIEKIQQIFGGYVQKKKI